MVGVIRRGDRVRDATRAPRATSNSDELEEPSIVAASFKHFLEALTEAAEGDASYPLSSFLT